MTKARGSRYQAALAGGEGAAPAPQAPLGKHADTPSRSARRDESWRLRRRLWELSGLDRVRKCGRVTRTGTGGPSLRLSDTADGRVAGLAGLTTCGSVWACPVCARRIGARRAEEIKHVVDGVFGAGGGACLITLTLRHHQGQSLRESWDALRYAWGRVVSGRRYMAEMERFGIVGWASVVEVTHGDAGWHPHMHVLVLFDVPTSAEATEALGTGWWLRWERALGRRGYSGQMDRGGLDVRLVTPDDSAGSVLGNYLSKIAHEVTSGHTKQARRGNRTPFALLRDGLATGLADDLEAWWTWERASHGRKQLTWAAGTRARFGLTTEQTDEEIAAEDIGSSDLIALAPATWQAIRDRAEVLLGVAEVGGLHAACRWLDARGLAWSAWSPKGRGQPPPAPAGTPERAAVRGPYGTGAPDC